MSQVVKLLKFEPKTTKNSKAYHLATFQDAAGAKYDVFDWGKWSAPAHVGHWWTVNFDPHAQFPRVAGKPVAAEEPKNVVQTELAEPPQQQSNQAPSPQRAPRSSVQASLSNHPRYLAMKLAVEMVREEAIEVDKKEARLRQYYELIYGELTKD